MKEARVEMRASNEGREGEMSPTPKIDRDEREGRRDRVKPTPIPCVLLTCDPFVVVRRCIRVPHVAPSVVRHVHGFCCLLSRALPVFVWGGASDL